MGHGANPRNICYRSKKVDILALEEQSNNELRQLIVLQNGIVVIKNNFSTMIIIGQFKHFS